MTERVKPCTSASVMRPLGPEPLTSFSGTPNSRANLRTEGDAWGKPSVAPPGLTPDPGWTAVSSSFFEVRGRLRLDQVALEEVSAVRRDPASRQVTTLWRERTAIGVPVPR